MERSNPEDILSRILADRSGIRLGDSIACVINSVVTLSQKSKHFKELKDYDHILCSKIVDETIISIIGSLYLLAGYSEQEIDKIVDNLMVNKEFDA